MHPLSIYVGILGLVGSVMVMAEEPATSADLSWVQDATKKVETVMTQDPGLLLDYYKQANKMQASTSELLQRNPDLMAATKEQGSAGTALAALRSEHDRIGQQLNVAFGSAPGMDAAQLYIFVSSALDDSLIRQYQSQAAWGGANLVFKGPPPGENPLKWFLTMGQKFRKPGGGTNGIIVDPRLFEMFDVQNVPTIVWTTTPIELQCDSTQLGGPVSGFPATSKTRQCPLQPSDTFWKISGAVPIDWAMEQFRSKGAPGLEGRLNRMKSSGLVAVDSGEGYPTVTLVTKPEDMSVPPDAVAMQREAAVRAYRKAAEALAADPEKRAQAASMWKQFESQNTPTADQRAAARERLKAEGFPDDMIPPEPTTP